MKNISVFLFLFAVIVFPASTEETGYASWYGGKFQGRKTANGEIFDTNQLTAAHKTLPFGSIVKVLNLENGKTVTVRINDRGPFIEGRIIDLSRAAAEEIGMLGTGIAMVKLEILARGASTATGPPGTVTVQVGAFRDQANALRIKNSLKAGGLKAEIESVPGGINRVIIPGVAASEVDAVIAKLKRLGYANPLIKQN